MKKGIIILLVTTIGLGSCKKFLTETPYSLLSTNNFYQTAGDASVALNGVFAPMTAQTYYGRTSWTVTELGGEDLTVPANSSSDRITLGNYTANSSNGEDIYSGLLDRYPMLWLFTTVEGVEPTNNLAEQAIRFVVIDRLITQGTRSERSGCDRRQQHLAEGAQARCCFPGIVRCLWVGRG